MITSEIDLLQWLASGTQRFAWERVSSIRWKDSGQAAQILRQCKQQGYIAEAEEVDYLLYKKLDPKERYIRLTQKGYKHLQKAHTTYLTEEFNRNKLLKLVLVPIIIITLGIATIKWFTAKQAGQNSKNPINPEVLHRLFDTLNEYHEQPTD